MATAPGRSRAAGASYSHRPPATRCRVAGLLDIYRLARLATAAAPAPTAVVMVRVGVAVAVCAGVPGLNAACRMVGAWGWRCGPLPAIPAGRVLAVAGRSSPGRHRVAGLGLTPAAIAPIARAAGLRTGRRHGVRRLLVAPAAIAPVVRTRGRPACRSSVSYPTPYDRCDDRCRSAGSRGSACCRCDCARRTSRCHQSAPALHSGRCGSGRGPAGWPRRASANRRARRFECAVPGVLRGVDAWRAVAVPAIVLATGPAIVLVRDRRHASPPRFRPQPSRSASAIVAPAVIAAIGMAPALAAIPGLLAIVALLIDFATLAIGHAVDARALLRRTTPSARARACADRSTARPARGDRPALRRSGRRECRLDAVRW